MGDTRVRRSMPLYQSVGDDIVSQIDDAVWQPGDKLPSERALCDMYRVSQITVRRALRELAHQGRVYSRHGLGWFVTEHEAETIVEREVALVLPQLDWRLSAVAQALSARLEERAVLLRMVYTDGDARVEARRVAAALERGTSALLLVVTGREREIASRYAQLLRGIEVPVLYLLRPVTTGNAPALTLDESRGMERITTHLLDLGHCRVAYAGSNPSSVEGQQRYRGFASTLWNRGLELPLDWVFAEPLSGESGAQRFRRVFSQMDRPTAMVCASDLLAAEALSLLSKLGVQCPEEVAVVGMGDRDFSAVLCPPLTTLRMDYAMLGTSAGDMICDLMDGRVVGSRAVLGELVLRESCGARFSRF